MTTDDDLRLLTAAYVLGAVDVDEQAEFEALLARSPELRAEVDELRDTAADLAWITEPVMPSTRLKSDLMAMLDSTPQLPPREEPAESPAEEGGSAPVTPLRGGADAVPSTSSSSHLGGLESASDRASRRWFRRPGTVLGVAAAAVALVVGGAVAGSSIGGLSGTQQAPVASAFDQVATAPDVVMDTRPVVGGGTATVYFSASQGKSAVKVANGPSIPNDRVMQLWYVEQSRPVSAGIMSPEGGSGQAVLEGRYTPGATVAITVEPAGGSDQPTTSPIVAVTAT